MGYWKWWWKNNWIIFFIIGSIGLAILISGGAILFLQWWINAEGLIVNIVIGIIIAIAIILILLLCWASYDNYKEETKKRT